MQVFYECQRCGNCCRWPGWVKLTSADVERMSAFLNKKTEDFANEYTELHESRQFLTLRNKLNGECIFYENYSCQVHPAKPIQCQGFPNKWNFPGWQEVCEAIPREVKPA